MILAQGDWRKVTLPQSHCFRVDQPRGIQFFDSFPILVPGGTALALEIFLLRASHDDIMSQQAARIFPTQ
jgi:hypothetical protein